MMIKKCFERLKKARMVYKPHVNVIGAVFLFLSFLVRRFLFRINEIDFYELALYKKSLLKCSQYFVGRFEHKFVNHFDTIQNRGIWNDKTFLYKKMNKFISRQYVITKNITFNDFNEFCKNHSEFIFKPTNQDCGRGVRKISVNKENLLSIYNTISLESGIIEEKVVQSNYLMKICPASLNTVRVFTVRINKKIYFIGSCLRIGNGKDVIDNYSSGGYVVALDEKGKAIGNAENMFCERFTKHLVTGFEFKKIQIPNWDKLIRFVNDCALAIDLNYVAWDIAVTEKGFVLIEANPHGMANVIQIAGAPPRKKQYKELYKLSFK